jgi:hypothetical protein
MTEFYAGSVVMKAWGIRNSAISFTIEDSLL